MWSTNSLEKTLMLGKIQGKRRGGRGWDGWMASPTQWTWGWASSGRQGRTGKPRLLGSMGSQRVGLDLATEQQQEGESSVVAPTALSDSGRTVTCPRSPGLLLAEPRRTKSAWHVSSWSCCKGSMAVTMCCAPHVSPRGRESAGVRWGCGTQSRQPAQLWSRECEAVVWVSRVPAVCSDCEGESDTGCWRGSGAWRVTSWGLGRAWALPQAHDADAGTGCLEDSPEITTGSVLKAKSKNQAPNSYGPGWGGAACILFLLPPPVG